MEDIYKITNQPFCQPDFIINLPKE